MADPLTARATPGGLVCPVGSPRRPTRPASSTERERIAAVLQDFDRRGRLVPAFA